MLGLHSSGVPEDTGQYALLPNGTWFRPNDREPNALASGVGSKPRYNPRQALKQGQSPSAHENLNQVPFDYHLRKNAFVMYQNLARAAEFPWVAQVACNLCREARRGIENGYEGLLLLRRPGCKQPGPPAYEYQGAVVIDVSSDAFDHEVKPAHGTYPNSPRIVCRNSLSESHGPSVDAERLLCGRADCCFQIVDHQQLAKILQFFDGVVCEA